MEDPKLLAVFDALDGVFFMEYIRGRFAYDGINPGRGELRYWLNDISRFTEEQKIIWVPPMPELIKEKIALLDVSGRGERVIGVGKKQSSLVYYLHFTLKEIQQMESEYAELRTRSDQLGSGERISQT